MESGINFTSNLGSNPGIELDTPRFKVYSFGGRVTSGGGKFEADNCMYNTIKNSLFNSASLVITPNSTQEGKLYSVIPSDGSGDMSVTRATTATRVNSQGLVELVPYNLLSYSEQLNNAAWAATAVVTANSTTAPNGTLTADSVMETATSDYHILGNPIATSSGTVYTFSFFAKPNGRNFARVLFGNSNFPNFEYAYFNLLTGAVSASSLVTASTINVGNGWVRCIATITSDANATDAAYFGPARNMTDGYAIYPGNASSGIYAWGVQQNEGTLKDYQKTETRLNIPRLDYSNGTCPSILVEPQRTNLLTWSSSFDNAAWDKGSINVTTNSIVSPSGIQDAEKIEASGSGSTSHYIRQFISTTSGTVYSFSIYAKKGTTDWIILRHAFGGTLNFFNLNTGTKGATCDASATIDDAGNGWYRLTVFHTGGGTNGPDIYVSTGNGISEFVANGENVYIWGAQYEAGSYPTSYIPTTSASVTRNADVISKTGISSLIGQTEGTIFCEINFDINVNTTGSSRIQLSDGTTTNWIFIGIPDGLSGNLIRMFCNSPSGTMSEFTSSPIANGVNKIAFAYKSGSFVLYVNGTQAASSSSSITIPTCSRIDLQGQTPNQSAFERINYNSAALWKTRLTNAQLATLTTI